MRRISFLAMYAAYLHQEKPDLTEFELSGQVQQDLEFVIKYVKNAEPKSLDNMIDRIEKDLTEAK